MDWNSPNQRRPAPPRAESVPVVTVASPPAEVGRRPMFSAVRWGAVLAGVAVGLSIQLLLTLLGIASGISTASVTEDDSVTAGTGPLLWAGVSMVVSAFVGGYVAARMSGLKRRIDGVLHGAVSWAVTTLLFAALATTIGGAMVGSVFTSMNQVAQAQEQVAEGQGPLAAFLREQFGLVDVITRAQLEQFLQNGERQAAVNLLTARTGMDERRASAVVDQALILAGAPQAASPQTRQQARAMLRGAGVAAWVVFGAVALGLLLGIGGGTLGVAASRRTNWSAGNPA